MENKIGFQYTITPGQNFVGRISTNDEVTYYSNEDTFVKDLYRVYNQPQQHSVDVPTCPMPKVDKNVIKQLVNQYTDIYLQIKNLHKFKVQHPEYAEYIKSLGDKIDYHNYYLTV